jgi:predicted TIM-barrel fold metal-dependent hydrolase
MRSVPSKGRFSSSRREILRLALVALANSSLSGCRLLFTKPLRPVCEIPPAGPPPAELPALTIDVHCHFFNGSDLQVEKFFDLVTLPNLGLLGSVLRAFSGLVQSIFWSDAPTGREELRALKDTPACPKGELKLSEKDLESFAARNRHRPHSVPSHTRSQLFSACAVTPPPGGNEDLRVCTLSETETSPSTRTAAGGLEYFKQNFQYRFVSFQEYLATFKAAGRPLDLMLANLVDYDWWLSKGHPTQTRLPRQVEVMEEISVLSKGRVHAFVPFDPLKEVAYRAGRGHRTGSSLKLAQEAVQSRGCIGVKLYPPMGFAPYGNASIPCPDFWKRPWLPHWLDGSITYPDEPRSRSLGQRLDDALDCLYEWCTKEDVPITAHTTMSNGPISKFEYLAGSYYWAKALSKWPGLRINFGHLGDFSDPEKLPGCLDSDHLIELMQDREKHPHVHADASYFQHILMEDKNKEKLEERIRSHYQTCGDPLPRCLMYGTDWSLLLNEGDVSQYLADFIQLFAKMEKDHTCAPDGASRRFFGYNAVEWMGLRRGEPARRRLEAFYQSHGLDPVADRPTWMNKVDQAWPEGAPGGNDSRALLNGRRWRAGT